VAKIVQYLTDASQATKITNNNNIIINSNVSCNSVAKNISGAEINH
jgi:hypothetical protein